MVKYEQSTIYKICCKDPEIKDEYIGSTTNFSRRKAEHKKTCIYEAGGSYNMNVYKCIRDNGGFDNWDMVEVEKYNATDKNDLHKRERYYIETLKPTLNKAIPTRTIKEYYTENKETIIENIKKNYIENKEQINTYKKEWYENNKEKIAKQKKEYHEKNKEKIAEKQAEKIVCECGIEITKYKKSRHEKSKRHVEFLKSKIPSL